MSKNTRIKRSPKKRNLGLGRNAKYAVKNALALMYGGDGHYSTRFTHHSRFLSFLDWLSNIDPPLTDLRSITLEHAMKYGEGLATAVQNDEMEVSFAQNLLSTVNVVMRAVRRDRKISLSPSQIVGARSYIRETLPEATWDKINQAVELAEQQGNIRGAAFILMTRAFGMRAREAALADLNRLKKELDLNGAVLVLEGTKGGFKSEDRIIQVESDQRRALEYAINAVSESGTCLIDTNDSYKEFLNRCINPVRHFLKAVGIRCPHDLRAEMFIEAYEQESGQQAPLKQCGPFDRDADLRGRKAVGKQGGHKRPTISSSYVGKRHRTDRDGEATRQ
jgi:integrase